MAKSEITSISTKLHDLLEPLDPALRKRAIRAALMMLGDEDLEPDPIKKKGKNDEGGDTPQVGGKAKAWMRSHGVTNEHLGHVFHVEDDTIDIIATDVPGASGRERTINAYLLTGIGELLRTGVAKFDDKAGRDACDKLGCYQGTNHSTIMKKHKGNVLTGTKGAGWTVTGPGLKAGAELIKGLTPA